MSMIEDKQVLQAMMERETGNLYENLRSEVLNIVSQNPALKTIANNYIKANEKKWIDTIQEKLDIIVETSFPTPNTTLEEAIGYATNTINNSIGGFLEEKLQIPTNSINVVLQLLLGQQI